MAVRLLMGAPLIVADPTGSLETPDRGLNSDNSDLYRWTAKN
jgi:hypothetical protein